MYSFMYSIPIFAQKIKPVCSNIQDEKGRFIILGTVTLKNSKWLMQVKCAYVY